MRSGISGSQSRSARRRCALFSLVVIQAVLSQVALGMPLELVGQSTPAVNDDLDQVSISTSAEVEDDGLGQAGDEPDKTGNGRASQNGCAEPNSAGVPKDQSIEQRYNLAPEREDYGADCLRLIEHPYLASRFAHYTLSADERAGATATSSSLAIQNLLLAVRENPVGASDKAGREYSESLPLYSDASQSFGIGAGFGVVLAKPGWSEFVGSFETSAKLRGATIVTDVSRGLLGTTVKTLGDRVQQTDFGISESYELIPSLSAGMELHHRIFSDNNSSDGAGLLLERAIDLQGAKLSFGSRLRCADFQRDSRAGYFSPNRTVSNEAFLDWAFNRQRYYSSIDLGLGRQMVRSWDSSPIHGSWSEGYSGSGDLALGLRLNRTTVVESYLSAEREAQETAYAWDSITTGCKVVYAF